MPPEKENPERKKSEILSQCPYTKMVLENPLHSALPSTWHFEFSRESAMIEAKIANKFGENWSQRFVGPQLIWSTRFKLFLQSLEPIDTQQVVKTLLKSGFEMGGSSNSQILQPDLMKKLQSENLLNNELFHTNVGVGILNSGLKSIFESGIFLKNILIAENPDLPPGIQRSLDEIDFTPLDPDNS